MRISLVCPYALSVPGGVQNQVLGLARTFASGGDAVQVLAPGPVGARSSPDEADGRSRVDVVGLGASVALRANGSRAPVALSPVAVARGLGAIRRFAPDVVHLHEPLAPALGPAVLATSPQRRGTAARNRRPALVGTFHRAGAGFGYRLYGHAGGRLFDRLDAVVAVSSPARETLEAAVGRHRAERCGLSFNAVDLGRFAGASHERPDGRPVIAFAGRHEARKGLSVLLDAVSGLGDDVVVWVIGEGPETSALRAKVASDARISWLGRVDDAELASRFAAASVVVVPSLGGESFGIVALEAMAAGTPVVASDLPGHRAAAGDAARYVAPGDAAALRAALTELLRDATARGVLAASGRSRAAQRSFEALAASYRALFEEALRR